jgi:hypothetical protein
MGAIGSSGSATTAALQNLVSSTLTLVAAINDQTVQLNSRMSAAEGTVNTINVQQQQNVSAIGVINATLAAQATSLSGINTTQSTQAAAISQIQTTQTAQSNAIAVLQGAGIESVSGATATPGANTIRDASLNAWTVTGGGVVQRGGSNIGTSSAVTLLLYYGALFYYKNATVWFQWNGSAWVSYAAGDPRAPAAPAESTSGSTATPGTGTLYDAALNLWTVTGGGVVQKNGSNAGTSSGVTLLLYFTQVFYYTTGTTWYSWSGTAWAVYAAGDPRNPSIISESAQGTVITPGDGLRGGTGGTLYDANLDAWTIHANHWGAGLHAMMYSPAATGYPAVVPAGGGVSSGNNDAQEGLYWSHSVYQGNSARSSSTGWFKEAVAAGPVFSATGPFGDPRSAASGNPLQRLAAAGNRRGICIEATDVSLNELTSLYAAGIRHVRITPGGVGFNNGVPAASSYQPSVNNAVAAGMIVTLVGYLPYGTGATWDATTQTKFQNGLTAYANFVKASNYQNSVIIEAPNELAATKVLLQGTVHPQIVGWIRAVDPTICILLQSGDHPFTAQSWLDNLLSFDAPYSDPYIGYGWHWYPANPPDYAYRSSLAAIASWKATHNVTAVGMSEVGWPSPVNGGDPIHYQIGYAGGVFPTNASAQTYINTVLKDIEATGQFCTGFCFDVPGKWLVVDQGLSGSRTLLPYAQAAYSTP